MFGLLVFVHEFGHFIFAKRAGMLVREFAIGFGPKVFSFKKSETLYTIRILPMGGYVRVAGEDPEIIDLKPGQHIGLTFNPEGQIDKIIVNNKEKHPTAQVIEVERADLDHELIIEGYDVGEDQKRTFAVSPTADYVMNEVETQIAPYDRQFASKTKRQRALQLFAGPMMNFILTFVIFVILGAVQGMPVEEARMGDIQADSPAAEAGFVTGDEVTAIEGMPISTWLEFQETVRANPEQPITMTINRSDAEAELIVIPRQVDFNGEDIGQIGVTQYLEKSLIKAIPYGLTETYHTGRMIIDSLAMLITGQFSIDMLSGPVGIYDATDQVVQAGFFYFLTWTALLSVNLGIINLVPLPALDGGRLFFVAIEAVRGKPIAPEKEGIFHFVGFALLMLLMIIVTWNDIQRLFL